MKVYITNTDTSQDSYIYNALYPTAIEISYCLLLMDEVENKVFASKAVVSGYSDYLELRCSEVGIERKQATYAMPTVTFSGKVGTKIPTNFIVSTGDNRQYTVSADTVIGSNGTVDAIVTASASGSLYNVKAGEINYIPVKISGITSVTNSQDYNDAYDKETDENLYTRYLLKVQKPASSGNVADYEEWIMAIDGIGAVTVYPLKDENLETKNGYVTCVIINSNNEPASTTLIQNVQNIISPDDFGLGQGESPIGAKVIIRTVEPLTINISANVSIDTETTLATITTAFQTNLNNYFKNIVFDTKKIVYKKVESLLIDINEVLDIDNLTINGETENITLSALQLAEVGTINIGLMS
jgi:uncharacterized phage protein gp47/JayE